MTVLPFTFTTERLVQHVSQLPSRHHPSSMLYSAHPGTTQAQCCMYSAHPGTTKVQCCTLPILAPPKFSAVLCPSWHHPSAVLYSAHPGTTQVQCCTLPILASPSSVLYSAHPGTTQVKCCTLPLVLVTQEQITKCVVSLSLK